MATREEAENAIKEYPHVARDIHRRRLEIKVPFVPFEDENVNGGRAQNVRNEAVENMIINLGDDPELTDLYNARDAVECVLNQCVNKQVRSLLDKATYDIIYEFYLRETQIYNAEGIGKKVNLSRARVYARKDAFVDAVRKELSKRDGSETNTPK